MKNLYNSKPMNSALIYVLISAGLMGILSSTMAQNNPWTQKADMPTARLGLATSEVDGKIYAIGGYRAADVFAPEYQKVEEYNPETDSWTTKAPMPTGRHWLAASAVNGKIYAIGGWVNRDDPGLSAVEEYDPVTDTWTKRTNMPTARLGLATGVVNGKIYVIGGASSVSQILSTMETYDPLTDTWSSKTDMPTKRFFLSAAAVDGKIYAIGGTPGSPTQPLSTVEEYDPDANTWTKKADMPTARFGCAVSVVNGKIYVIGGRSGNEVLSTVEEYDPATDAWTQKTDMPVIRGAFSSSTVNEKIYTIGGVEIAPPPHPGVKTVYQYDPSKDLATLVKTFNISKCFVEAGNDSICFTTKIDDPAGVTLFAMIESPDQTCIDSIQLFDDGNHNDENAGDSLYANVWPVSSAEERHYYVDLEVTRIDADTAFMHVNNMASFTTIGPVTFENYTFTFAGTDTIPNPGDMISFQPRLRNNSSTAIATDIIASLSVSDTNASLDQLGIRSYGDISPGATSVASGYCKIQISENCPVNTEIPIKIDIYSSGFKYWCDTFSILVQDTIFVDIREPIREPIAGIYPNPTDNVLNIEISNTGKQGVEIEILDITGKVIYQKEYKNINAHFTENIDLSGCTKGIYFVKVRLENNVSIEKLIVY